LRAVLIIVAAALVLALGCVQIASDALFARAGVPRSLPSRLSFTLGERAYRVIERVAPAPFVEAMLAQDALENGDVATAQAHALLMPASPVRNELLARIAQAQGERALALEYFLVAPDVAAVQEQVRKIAHDDPVAALDLESRLKDRLDALTVHPDAVAEAYWVLGQLWTDRAYRDPSHRDAMFREGLQNYRSAVSMAPLSEKYLLAVASQYLTLHDWPSARRFFQRGVDVDPSSADAYAGLGIVLLHGGDVSGARQYASRARSLDPGARILHDLERQLR
jgi:tetratricopeptide (TPR) repeat protein